MSNIATNVPMAPVTERRLRDYSYIANVAGPAAGANANTAALDLIQPQFQSGQSPGAPNSSFSGGSSGPYSVTERFWVNVQVTAGGATANNKNLNVSIEHTGALANGTVDTGNFVSIPQIANPVLRGIDANGGGLSANSVNFMLPPDVKRFIRLKAALEANGGNAANSTTSLALYF